MGVLSKTRLADVGEAAEINYTVFLSERAPHLKREAGVSIKTRRVPKFIGKLKAINNCLMIAQFPLTKNCCYTLINVYAPTMQHSEEDKEKFYSKLKAVIDTIPKLIIFVDFNADWSAWDGILGRLGVGQCHCNSHLELCNVHDLWPEHR